MTRCLTLICVLAVAGCASKPAPQIQTLSDVTLADDAVSLALTQAVASDAVNIIVAQDTDGSAPEQTDGLAQVLENIQADIDPVANAVVPAAVPKQGFFSRMFGNGPKPAVVVAADGQGPADVVAVVHAPVVPAPRQAGFLSGIFAPKTAVARTVPDAREVSLGALLPYGEIARNCAVSRRLLGTKVDENAGYSLYDTSPQTTDLRTHYITGFKDKCARQFTAATSMMADIGTYEAVRYLPSNAKMDYSAADTAYEAIKSSYCRVGHGEPCGNRLDRLAKRTTFVTAYSRFGVNPTWSNILLHQGDVVAMGPAEP